MELSIIMPCLNEAETLETCIGKAQRFLSQNGIAGEIVVGDNGSTDGSQEIARRGGARVVDVPVRGYGAAVYHAALAARGTYFIMGDADDSYDFTDLTPFLEKLRAGCDLVMGNRFRGGIKPGAMPWKNRMIGNPVLSGIGRLFFHCPARDFHCGLRGFSAEAFKRLDLRTTGMEFASEMVIKATLLGMKIAEVPTTLSPDGRSRAPHLRPWRDGWRHLRFMFLYSPRWLFLYPGFALMLAGSAIGLWLLPGPRSIGSVTLDVHTMLLAAAAVLIGFQSVAFAAFSKIYAVMMGLLPPNRVMERLFRVFTLEVGLSIGVLLMAVGAGGVLYGLVLWEEQAFGQMVPTQLLRILIPSSLLLSLGCQVVLSSFFLSVLGLNVSPHEWKMKFTDRLLQKWRISKARPYVPHGARVLDIGCANGEFYFQVPGIAEYVGIDPGTECSVHRDGFHLLKGYFPAALRDAFAGERESGPSVFDCITMLAVLEHIEDPEFLGRECFGTLRPGRRLIITVPRAIVDRILKVLLFLRLIHGMNCEQHKGYDVGRTEQIFEKAGFRLTKRRSFQLGLNCLFVFAKPDE